MRLADKVALVTGAGSGFGEGMARRFASEGAKVAVADINGEAADRVAREINAGGATALALTANVADGGDVVAMVAATKDAFGPVEIMVNNAGVAQKNGPALEVAEDVFDHIFAVNVKAIYLTTRAVLPAMIEAGTGVILNTSSTAALRPRPGLAWYNASKGAVNVLTKSLAVEFAPQKIRVNALCPVVGETGMLATFMGGIDTPEIRQKFIDTIPLGRFSTPDDIAEAAVYLCSDAASMVTGVCLEIDGGRCI
ncbi:MAG: glucose 1-dehydrogenase [Alphaproteobacteria bacterium]|nr:glucose 1-dehydrogenase [Alphaproteobacteria bacterium]